MRSALLSPMHRTTHPELLGSAIEWIDASTLEDAVRVDGETPGIDAVLLP